MVQPIDHEGFIGGIRKSDDLFVRTIMNAGSPAEADRSIGTKCAVGVDTVFIVCSDRELHRFPGGSGSLVYLVRHTAGGAYPLPGSGQRRGISRVNRFGAGKNKQG